MKMFQKKKKIEVSIWFFSQTPTVRNIFHKAIWLSRTLTLTLIPKHTHTQNEHCNIRDSHEPNFYEQHSLVFNRRPSTRYKVCPSNLPADKLHDRQVLLVTSLIKKKKKQQHFFHSKTKKENVQQWSASFIAL